MLESSKKIRNLIRQIESDAIHHMVHDHYENKTSYCLDSDKEEQLKLGFEMVVDAFFKDLDRDTRTAIFEKLYEKHKEINHNRYL